MEINENVARITCPCGKIFQVLKNIIDENTGEVLFVDWDEEATKQQYEEHLKKEHNI